MKRILWLIFIAVFVALTLRTFVFEGIYIASDSMLPTLQKNDHFFVDKITYNFRLPRRNEIIVFKSSVADKKDFIKRVIAVDGDTISIENKDVFVNEQRLTETYVQYTRPDDVLKGDKITKLKIPQNCFFVLGDNRDESNDSRDWIDSKTGENVYFVHKNFIKGKIIKF
ncbi:MAG: signal peptidase I [Elusimicrobiota bacterium]